MFEYPWGSGGSGWGLTPRRQEERNNSINMCSEGYTHKMCALYCHKCQINVSTEGHIQTCTVLIGTHSRSVLTVITMLPCRFHSMLSAPYLCKQSMVIFEPYLDFHNNAHSECFISANLLVYLLVSACAHTWWVKYACTGVEHTSVLIIVLERTCRRAYIMNTKEKG